MRQFLGTQSKSGSRHNFHSKRNGSNEKHDGKRKRVLSIAGLDTQIHEDDNTKNGGNAGKNDHDMNEQLLEVGKFIALLFHKEKEKEKC